MQRQPATLRRGLAVAPHPNHALGDSPRRPRARPRPPGILDAEISWALEVPEPSAVNVAVDQPLDHLRTELVDHPAGERVERRQRVVTEGAELGMAVRPDLQLDLRAERAD